MKIDQQEKKIVIWFTRPKSKFLDTFSSIISSVPLLTIGWIAVAALSIVVDFFRGVPFTFALAIVFILHFIISEGFIKWGCKKINRERIRPYLLYPKEIKGIGKKFSDSSFPSSHVAAMVAGLTVTIYFFPAIFPWSFSIVGVLGWSRLRNGMHYLSDIIAGIALGLIYGYLALWILSKII